MAQCIRILMMPTTTGDMFLSGARLLGLALGWPSTWPVTVRSALQTKRYHDRNLSSGLKSLSLKRVWLRKEGSQLVSYLDGTGIVVSHSDSKNYSQMPYLCAGAFP